MGCQRIFAVNAKRIITLVNVPIAGDALLRNFAQPIPDEFDERLNASAMRRDVVTGQIGKEFLIAVRVGVHNEASLLLLTRRVGAEFCAEENPQLKRHIEARQIVRPIQFGARDVVYSAAAAGNNPADFVQAVHFAAGVFQRAAGGESAVNDGEN